MPRVQPIKLNRIKRRTFWIFGAFLVLVITIILLFIFLPVEKRKTWPAFESNRPLVIAHQGDHLAPGNTMESFVLAKGLGVDVLEFDVHITKDGHLVTIHDSTVNRTTDGRGNVEDFMLNEL